jgi:malonyl-CoA decarboxylase
MNMAPVASLPADPATSPGPRSWLERLWASVADRGRPYAEVLQPEVSRSPLERARELAAALLSERGEASGAAVARELLNELRQLDTKDRHEFYRFLVSDFLPDHDRLKAAVEAYLAEPTPEHATKVAEAAEPTRQEVLRRMNMAPGGTASLIAMRKELLHLLRDDPYLKPLDFDLRHLLGSWFNRGFLELRRIDWQTPAAVLEKLIEYEAVHEIQGWDDLRRRLAPDRRCFGFFHPALPGEPLIFVEVALTRGLADSIQPLLVKDGGEAAQRERERAADTAIFYSISNCQEGLRGISFGNFLIKQVVEELKAELPGLVRFSTLSPVPSFRRWLETQLATEGGIPLVREAELPALRQVAGEASQGADRKALLRLLLAADQWWEDEPVSHALRAPLTRLCALYLTTPAEGRKDGSKRPADPVARFHLGNGARLERVNWRGNIAPRGMRESYGIMVNYLYDPEQIEANHEAFVRGTVVRSQAVDTLLAGEDRPPATLDSGTASRARRSRKN